MKFPGVKSGFDKSPPFPPKQMKLGSNLFALVIAVGEGKIQPGGEEFQQSFHKLAEAILVTKLSDYKKSDEAIFGAFDVALISFCLRPDGTFRPDITAGSLEIPRQRYGLRTVLVHLGRLDGREYSTPIEQAGNEDDDEVDPEFVDEYDEYLALTGSDAIAYAAVLADVAYGPEPEESLRLEEEETIGPGSTDNMDISAVDVASFFRVEVDEHGQVVDREHDAELASSAPECRSMLRYVHDKSCCISSADTSKCFQCDKGAHPDCHPSDRKFRLSVLFVRLWQKQQCMGSFLRRVYETTQSCPVPLGAGQRSHSPYQLAYPPTTTGSRPQ